MEPLETRGVQDTVIYRRDVMLFSVVDRISEGSIIGRWTTALAIIIKKKTVKIE